MPIRILADEVAAKIAAGEVIERPASVVKELIENAIDAGASSIHIEVRQGGRRLMRVADEGSGIPADEVELAFARHATSKLQSVEDLTHIATLGFRGEALASIAAVSQVTLLTCADGEAVGTRLRVEGSRVTRREPCGHPRGTTVTVENLFYNVPARLKFLRTDATERKHIDNLVVRYAMAYPGLRFVLENDGRLTFRSPGSGSLRDVLIEVYGLDVAGSMIEVRSVEASERSAINVSGFVSPPSAHRSNRDHMTLFCNGRWVQDRSLTFAIDQAYHTLIPDGRHPLAVIEVDLPPDQVDVNVHPTKAEVKFQRRNVVFRAVQRAVREALIAQAPIPEVSRHGATWGQDGWQERHGVLVGAGTAQAAMDLIPPREGEPSAGWTADALSRPGDRGTWEDEGAKMPPLRVLGQLAQTYVIAEGPEGMYLIDQHAAHERVLYEQLLAQQANAAVPAQSLLEPLTVELTPGQGEELELWLDALHRLGFEVEPFGGTTVLLRAVPSILARTDVRETFAGILNDLASGEDPLAQEKDARAAAAACKRGAVKAGQTLSQQEMRSLIAQLEGTRSPRTCPHGRPTMILLSQMWMEREFGRR
ncbi:MAG: DNA mismatch repair endonuclease MutL [Anaerolineae bacterium]|nr:DNA mismatch repair endonuclease MutL [Anaerolineae bacterium]